MEIRVVFYGGLRERCGRRTYNLVLAEPAAVDDALERLAVEFPGLEGRLDRIAVAVDDDLVSPDHQLEDGNELCLLPPVSGGA